MKDKFKNINVLVFGLGLNQGGVGSAKFFAENGAKVRVTDLKDKSILNPSLKQLKNFKNIKYTLGQHKNEDIDWADIIIRNPSIRNNNPYLEYALDKGKRVETDFSIFLEIADQKNLIAITGTKGKSTTASLIYEAIRASGQKVLFAGNIGKSILDTIPYLHKRSLIVVEISSFQLQALKDKNFAPKIAIITNIYPDHLNWHKSMEEYVEAKRLIAKKQTTKDFLVISCQDILNSKSFLKGINSKIIKACVKDLYDKYPNVLLPLKGGANLDNYALAFAVARILGIDDKKLLYAFRNFKGAQFRMQQIGEFEGVKIINDSTSTNPVSTIEAIRSLDNFILITGGMNKNLDYRKLASEIENNKTIKSLYLLEGDATKELIKFQKNKSRIKGVYSDLKKLLEDVRRDVRVGDTILFSPGATSFNLFQNEFDRGRKFNQAVEKVFKK